MPSSTSSFEDEAGARTASLRRATWTLLAAAAALYTCSEVVAVLGMEHVSKLHHRIMTDARQAQALRAAPAGQPPEVLFVGNSLLLEGVDFGALAEELRGRFRPRRYVIEATTYDDWLFGLKRLFRHGMRVNSVVLCVDALDFVPNRIRGDFSARVLFDAQDIWPVSRTVGADLTTTSSLYFAHYSMFYASRAELRSVLLGKISPAVVSTLQRSMWGGNVKMPADSDMVPIMDQKMLEMRKLCAGYGATFMFLIPPIPQGGDGAIVEAGRETGVRVLWPIPSGSLGAEFYREDGFHLNSRGAARFTQALGETLNRD
jgi:hypothetical protein